MVLNGFWQVFIGGMVGPHLMELVKNAGWRNAKKIRETYKEPLFLALTAALFILAGIVVVVSANK